MAAQKKTIEQYISALAKIDMKIEKATKTIILLKQEKQALKTKVNEIKALEILGIIEDSQLSYADAVELLKKQNPVITNNN